MQYTELGKTKENVSILGFGAMRLPTKGSNDNIDENTASEILSYGIDNGINLIDTAYPYHSAGIDGNGNSEVFIGNFLKENSYRESVTLLPFQYSTVSNLGNGLLLADPFGKPAYFDCRDVPEFPCVDVDSDYFHQQK